MIKNMSTDKGIEDDDRLSSNSKGLQLKLPKLSEEPKRPEIGFHYFRYVIIVLAGVMMGSMILFRINITIAMLSMVNTTALYLIEHPNSTAEEYFPPDYVETGEFVWNNEIQQIIISGYMIAYTIPQAITTKLAMKYGLRPSICLSLALCSISTLLTPIMSYWGWEWVLVLRLVNALGASAILPTMVNVIEEFMPYEDAPIGVAVFQFTTNMISVTTPLFIGSLASVHWKWAFYIPGIAGLIVCIVWYLIASDSPHKSKFVGQKELDLICGISADPTKQDNNLNKRSKKHINLPWYFMLKIKSFYALTIICSIYVGTSNAFFFLLPKYFNKILNVSVQDVGLLNFTVQIGALFSMLWSTPLTSFFVRKFNLSITAARRIVVSICSLTVATTYIYMASFHDNLVPVISINRFFHITQDTLTLATVMSQFGQAGASGLVYSMMNTLGNSSTVLFCWASGKLLDYTGETIECWSWILYSLAALMSLHMLIYVTCCHSRPVPIESSSVKKPPEDGAKACELNHVQKV